MSEMGCAHGTHVDYIARTDWTHFDDRSFTDEWQDGVYEYAHNQFTRRNFQKIVDFGCGSGFKLVKYFPPGATVGIELEPSLSYLSQKYPRRIWHSGESISEGIKDADMLICSDVIEHVPDPSGLLSTFANSGCELFVISTPALEVMAERKMSPRLGPPSNPSHIREWTTEEFHNFVSRYLRVVDHKITSLSQCTQMIAAIKK